MTNDPLFESFWNKYGKKQGKKNAIAQWGKLTKAEQILCEKNCSVYVKRCPEAKFRLDPERYIKYKRFNDEMYQEDDRERRPYDNEPSTVKHKQSFKEPETFEEWQDWFQTTYGIKPKEITPEMKRDYIKTFG